MKKVLVLLLLSVLAFNCTPEDGVDGINGINGTNGIDGKDGTDGSNGEDGTNGTNGTNGTDGNDGTNGTNGTNGTDGTYISYQLSEVPIGTYDINDPMQCASGGIMLTYFKDFNRDGILDVDDEIIGNDVICDPLEVTTRNGQYYNATEDLWVDLQFQLDGSLVISDVVGSVQYDFMYMNTHEILYGGTIYYRGHHEVYIANLVPNTPFVWKRY